MFVFGVVCIAIGLVGLYKAIDRWIREIFLEDNESRYILVTGCDMGFGNLVTKRLDTMGCHVFAGCLTEAGVEELKKECTKNVTPLRMDVSSADSVRKAFETVKKALPKGKGLWGVLNNAGIGGPCTPPEFLTLEDYKGVAAVNLYGLIDVTMTFLPLVKMERGRVVNVSSIFGRHSSALAMTYSVSKYGVEAFTDAFRRNMRPFEVTAILIEPGAHKTNMPDHHTLQTGAERVWRRAPQETREEYGDEFYEYWLTHVLAKLDQMASRRLDDVVDTYVHALLGRYPKARYVVGYDANAIWWTLQMLPEWLGDWILARVFRDQPLPASLKKKDKKV